MDELRKRGAVRVRDGSLEVAFSSPPISQEAANSGAPVLGMPVATGEAAELAELRAMRERLEELA